MIALTHDKIDYTRLTDSVRSNQAGAVVLFLGTVREMTNGRQTIALDYEAYPQMAETQLFELEREAREKWAVQEIGILHRLGKLGLGEISVAVAVSCAHRQEAFEVGKFLIDELKAPGPHLEERKLAEWKN